MGARDIETAKAVLFRSDTLCGVCLFVAVVRFCFCVFEAVMGVFSLFGRWSGLHMTTSSQTAVA